MSQNSSSNLKEVSESSFEYLLGELLALKPVVNTLNSDIDVNSTNQIDEEFAKSHQLDENGYNIGYR